MDSSASITTSASACAPSQPISSTPACVNSALWRAPLGEGFA